LGKVRRLSRVIRKGSWVFAAKLIVSFVAIVMAATISVTSSTYQAEVGSVVKFPAGLLATDKGFSASPTAVNPAGTSCGNPATFNTNTTANTNIVASDLVYEVQVNATGPPLPAFTKFNVTLTIGSNTYGPLCIQTLAVLTGTIDCKFDVGTALPASPYTFKVTIQ
jgi:hypothetical protein